MFSGESGGRARSTWTTCPGDGENLGKLRLIPDAPGGGHPSSGKGGESSRPTKGPRTISLLAG